MAKLVCGNCNQTIEVPSCCGESMMVKSSHLLCCCKSNMCEHQEIPVCCGKPMNYLSY